MTLAPNFAGAPWGTRVDAPRLLSSPALARYVPPGSTVLALPFGIVGDSMFWQVEAKFHFRLAGGYISIAPPAPYARYSTLLEDLERGETYGRFRRRLCEFIRFTGSSVILHRLHTPGYWMQLLAPLGVRPQRVGGFAIYELGAGAADTRCARILAPSTTGRPQSLVPGSTVMVPTVR